MEKYWIPYNHTLWLITSLKFQYDLQKFASKYTQKKKPEADQSNKQGPDNNRHDDKNK